MSGIGKQHGNNGHNNGKQRGGVTRRGFQPGQSGNPSGRPKGQVSITAIIRRKVAEAGPNGRLVAEELVDAWIEQAKAGNYQFAKEILERVDGKVPDRTIIHETRKEYDTISSPDNV